MPTRSADFEAVPGKGVRASLDGTGYYVGSPRLFEELGVPLDGAEERVEAAAGRRARPSCCWARDGPWWG